MLASEKIRKVFVIFGFDENKHGLRILPVMFIILSIPLCAGSLLYIIHNKGKYDATGMTLANMLRAAKDIDHMISILAFTVMYMYSSESMKFLLQVIDKKYSSYYNGFPEPQKKLINRSKIIQNNDLTETGMLVLVLFVVTVFLPGSASVYLIFKDGSTGVDVTGLPLPIIFWYPENYDTIKLYIIIFIFQTIYMSYIFSLAYIFFGSLSSSLQSIIIDIKLLCIDLGDIDRVLNISDGKRSSVLRDYMNYLIRCHQQIQSQVKLVSRSVSWVVTISNQSLCFQICTALYSAAEVENRANKIMFGVLILTVSLMLLAYSRNGQQIIDSSEEIRRYLYACSWVDKPLWFKKDLQIMMAMANVPLRIKPLGLYILGLNNFSYIMNAAYTYFNVLRTFKK